MKPKSLNTVTKMKHLQQTRLFFCVSCTPVTITITNVNSCH